MKRHKFGREFLGKASTQLDLIQPALSLSDSSEPSALVHRRTNIAILHASHDSIESPLPSETATCSPSELPIVCSQRPTQFRPRHFRTHRQTTIARSRLARKTVTV